MKICFSCVGWQFDKNLCFPPLSPQPTFTASLNKPLKIYFFFYLKIKEQEEEEEYFFNILSSQYFRKIYIQVYLLPKPIWPSGLAIKYRYKIC